MKKCGGIIAWLLGGFLLIATVSCGAEDSSQETLEKIPHDVVKRLGMGANPATQTKMHCWANVTDSDLKYLENLVQLRTLNLQSCENITDAGLAHLANLVQLQDLNLGGCKNITGAGLENLANLAQLQELNLGGCKNITDAGLVHLKNLAQLQVLGLAAGSKITKEGKENLKKLLPSVRLR